MPRKPPAEVQLQGRDLAIVNLVARFEQVASRHVHELLFPENTSYTPSDRALRRLVERDWLARIDIRVVGGRRGGSGQYVYQLGRRGFYLSNTGRYNPAKAIRFHTIAIVDVYSELVRLHRAGAIRVVGFSTEPDCHQLVGGVLLKPDLFVEVAKPSGERMRLWLEVDMGTERQKQLTAKLEAYYRAYSNTDASEIPIFPFVVWVAVDEEREKELSWLISQMPSSAQPLFKVTSRDRLYALLE